MARHPVPPAYGDLSAAALHFGVGRNTIVRLIESGAVPVYRLSPRGNRRVKFSDIEAVFLVEEADAS